MSNGADTHSHSEAAVTIAEQIRLSKCAPLNDLCLHAVIMQICTALICVSQQKK